MFIERLFSFNVLFAGVLLALLPFSHNGLLQSDRVNMPGADHTGQPEMTIAELVDVTERLSTLNNALEEAGLDEELAEDGPYTVFIPTDDAFNEMEESDLETLMDDPDALREVMEYHIIEGEVLSEDLTQNESVETRGGKAEVNASSSSIQVDDANVVQFDVQASNGVVHVIDTVLQP